MVPTVTFTSDANAPLTPVKLISSTVATSVPVLSRDLTVNGSVVGSNGFVTFLTTARPPASFVEVKISGCAPNDSYKTAEYRAVVVDHYGNNAC